jgi:2-dehydro-3-deoxygluconokinase
VAERVSRFDVTSFGETMLRLSVPPGHRLEEARQFEIHPGGAESNVCAALASLGRSVGWVSKLPQGQLGSLVVRRLRAAGIDTSRVAYAADARLGTYYVEFAVPPRATQVTYDRAGSAASRLSSTDIDWNYLLDTRVLHLTGITPALSDSCKELMVEAIDRAKAKGVPVSFDVNYRSRLWSAKEAAQTLRKLVRHVDILICGKGDACTVFGLDGDEAHVLEALGQLSDANLLVLTLGDNGVAAWTRETLHRQMAVRADIIDRVGAGDAMAAGVLDGYLDGSVDEGLRRGAALAALALSQHGDMLITSRQELDTCLSTHYVTITR